MPETKNISKQNWVSATFLLIISAIISKIFGFAREILIAREFGIASDVDAFLVALSIPLLIGTTIGVSFSFAMVPIYHKLLSENSGEAWVFLKTVFSFTMIVSFTLMAFIYFFPDTIIRIVAPSLSEKASETAGEMLRWLLFLLIGYSFFNVLYAIYNAIHHFKIPAITDMFSNLFIIFFLIFLSSVFGIYALIFGMAVSSFFVLVIFLIHLFYHKILGFDFNFNSPVFQSFLSFSWPILVFIFFMQMVGIIENYFASSLPGGSIASLGYAKRLYDIIPTLLVANIARALFPTFSTLYSENRIYELRELIIKLNKQFIIYFLPITFVLVFFRKEILSLVFLRGAFDETALNLTANAFMFYAFGLTGATLVPVFFRLCYALADSISPMIAIFVSTLFMLVLNYYLTPVMGISGIALTSSLTAMITMAMLGFLVRKKIGGLKLKEFGISFLFSLVCSVVALLPFIFISFSNKYHILFIIPLYFILYMCLGILVSNKEFSLVWVSLKRTFSRR